MTSEVTLVTFCAKGKNKQYPQVDTYLKTNQINITAESCSFFKIKISTNDLMDYHNEALIWTKTNLTTVSLLPHRPTHSQACL